MRGGRNKFGPMYKRDRAIRQQAMRQRQQLITQCQMHLTGMSGNGDIGPGAIMPPGHIDDMTQDIKPNIHQLLGPMHQMHGEMMSPGALMLPPTPPGMPHLASQDAGGLSSGLSSSANHITSINSVPHPQTALSPPCTSSSSHAIPPPLTPAHYAHVPPSHHGPHGTHGPPGGHGPPGHDHHHSPVSSQGYSSQQSSLNHPSPAHHHHHSQQHQQQHHQQQQLISRHEMARGGASGTPGGGAGGGAGHHHGDMTSSMQHGGGGSVHMQHVPQGQHSEQINLPPHLQHSPTQPQSLHAAHQQNPVSMQQAQHMNIQHGNNMVSPGQQHQQHSPHLTGTPHAHSAGGVGGGGVGTGGYHNISPQQAQTQQQLHSPPLDMIIRQTPTPLTPQTPISPAGTMGNRATPLQVPPVILDLMASGPDHNDNRHKFQSISPADLAALQSNGLLDVSTSGTVTPDPSGVGLGASGGQGTTTNKDSVPLNKNLLRLMCKLCDQSLFLLVEWARVAHFFCSFKVSRESYTKYVHVYIDIL